MSKDKILERIRKLLALSESPNEHEAALAAEKANAMLAEHNLSIDEVAGADNTIVEDDEFGTKHAPWYRLVCHWTGRLYFCGYFSIRKGGQSHHHFVGEKHNVEVARLMSEYLVKTIYRLSLESYKKHGVADRMEGATFRRSFRNAAAGRLAARIRDLIEERKRMGVTTSEGKHLPALLGLYQKADADFQNWCQNSGIRFGKPRGMMRSSHADGFRAGREAADRISLQTQVGTSSVKRIGHSK